MLAELQTFFMFFHVRVRSRKIIAFFIILLKIIATPQLGNKSL